MAEEPNIVLLHIGTNDISAANEDYSEVEDILTVIDDYEFASGTPVWVVLALIIDRGCDPTTTLSKIAGNTDFNDAVRNFVFLARQAGGDNILLVDMQNGAGIDYERWIWAAICGIIFIHGKQAILKWRISGFSV